MNVGFRINLAVACVSPPIGTSQADPTRTSTALTNGYQVVKSFRYLLTDPRRFDILQSGPWLAGIECNSIN